MIQRIQTVYLALAALCALLSGILFFVADSPLYVPAVVQILVGCVAIGTIFSYRNRRRQMRICLSLLCVEDLFYLAMIGLFFFDRESLSLATLADYVALCAPALTWVFCMLAWRGVRADDRLVRSVDRIR